VGLYAEENHVAHVAYVQITCRHQYRVIDDANDGGHSALSSDANKLDLCTAIQPGIADWAATCTEMAQHTNKLQIQNAVLQTILCGGCRGSPAPHPVKVINNGDKVVPTKF